MKPAKTNRSMILGGCFFLASVSMVSTPIHAGDFTGRIELSYQGITAKDDSLIATFGDPGYTGVTGNVRLMWRDNWGDWSGKVHYKLSAEAGESAAITSAISAAFPSSGLNTYFDLSHQISNNSDLIATHSIDRLSLTYTTPSTVIRVGRQALTWGSGRVFHPMDLVAPFSPDSTDTEFKPGVDMVYFQWLMDDGSDVEIIAVPRRSVDDGPATADASTFAARYRTDIADLGLTVVLARDHGDVTAGIGLSGGLGGAIWNAEIVPTLLSDGTVKTSGIANITTAMQLFGHTSILFAEYFHNGFGQTGSGQTLDSLPTYLTDRMALGQVFNISQDYLALGLSMELNPLLTLGSSAIFNLNDGSLFAGAELNWSLTDNANLMFGAQLPGGGNGTEFGGTSVSGGSGPYAAPQGMAYIRYRQYF